MRYPKKLLKRADKILATRRQTAQERHRRMMAALDEQHPEIRAVGQELTLLYTQRAQLQLDPGQDTGEVETAIREAQARREVAMAAVGLTEADLEPTYTCPHCRDRGVKEGGQMCECRQVILNQLVYEQLCDVSPARECSFENFELRYYGGRDRAAMGKVLESSQRYVWEFGGQSQSLLFTGAPGLGKTHLSLAIAEGVAKAGHLVMYVSAPYLMDQLELGKFQKDDAALEFREVIFGCDLLVIDDLGTELVTRYTQAEVYDLVNHRLNTGKPTIINTNLGLQEIERTYSSRVHSRLAGMYAVVQFKGRDIRLQKKQEGYR